MTGIETMTSLHRDRPVPKPHGWTASRLGGRASVPEPTRIAREWSLPMRIVRTFGNGVSKFRLTSLAMGALGLLASATPGRSEVVVRGIEAR